MNSTIRLTDTDGIVFDLDIDAVEAVAGIDSIEGSKTIVYVIDGSKIAVRETACEVMQMIVNARFGTQKSS